MDRVVRFDQLRAMISERTGSSPASRSNKKDLSMGFVCPRCEQQTLAESLQGTFACPQCQGMFVPRPRILELLADWAAVPSAGIPAEGPAALCPAGHGVMNRASVPIPSAAGAVYLDRCSSCIGVWFDSGEWTALASAHLLDHLDELWTLEWRNRLRRDQELAAHNERLRAEFGPALYDQLMNIAHELRQHPRRSQALALIREESA
jgi:hypothetical protein